MVGQRIIVAGWLTNVGFGLTAIPAAVGLEAFDTVAIVMALMLFVISIGVWIYTFGTALVRSARGDDIVVGSLFLVQGPSPRPVRVQLFSGLGVSSAIAAITAVAEPFGVLVPMLSLGLIGLWGARHGAFPARRAPTT